MELGEWKEERERRGRGGQEFFTDCLAFTGVLRGDGLYLSIFANSMLMPSELSTVQDTNVSSVTWTLKSVSL